MNSTIRLFVADDHEVVRAGLHSLVAAQTDVEVVGYAADGPGVIAGAARLTPDVLTLDLSMPGSVATEVIPTVLDVSPKTAVLVLTMHDDPLYVHSAMSAGARGYLVKSAASAVLIHAIHELARGGIYVHPTQRKPQPTSALRESAIGAASGEGDPESVRLSRREREVLILLAKGHTHREVADQLGVGINSVGTYRTRMSRKLGLHTRADVLRFAVREGMLAEDLPRAP